MGGKNLRVNTIKRILSDMIVQSYIHPIQRDVPLEQDIFHIIGSVRCAALLANVRNADMESAVTAMLLHDISRVKDGRMESHAVRSSMIAEEILNDTGLYAEKEIETIKNAIENHIYKDATHSELDELIKDADVLDGFLNGDISEKDAVKKRINKIFEELKIKI